jgi:hypothetical protein
VTDLRDQLADFDAAARRPRIVPTCHPDRTHKGRRLCAPCYEYHQRRGSLDRFPRTNLTRAEFVAAYTRLRAQGRSVRYVAWKLGITFDGLNRAYYAAVRAGALTPDRRTAV